MRSWMFACLLAAMAWWWSAAPATALCLCTCSVSATDVSFGAIDPVASSTVDGAGVVSVTCSPLAVLASYEVRLSTGVSGVYTARTMRSGANALSYNLFTDAGRTQIWGDGSGGTDTRTASYILTVGNATRTYTMYARAPSVALARPGAYSDTVTVTVVY
ncbi:MAG: spore coat U domain-containing protein [Hyphomonadaceae bacterium]|nr:spore coat U domain-containing protein [Hyphomonadaceae bacterium]